MRKVVFISGLVAGLISAGMFFIVKPLSADGTFKGGELLGYATMVIGLSMIFFGIKTYRDKHSDGEVKFGKAFLVGLYISLVACVLYAAGWELYLSTTDAGLEGFMKVYAEGTLARLKESGASAETIKAATDKAMASMSYYRNPLFRFAITMTEMLPVGLLISLISAAILKNKNVLPAQKAA